MISPRLVISLAAAAVLYFAINGLIVATGQLIESQTVQTSAIKHRNAS